MNNVIKVKDEAEVYHSSEHIGKSQLFKMSKSPAHFKNNLDTPFEKTKALLIGSAFHCLVLEPEKFDEQYAVMSEEFDGRTAAGRAFKRNAEEEGFEILTYDEYEMIQGMATSVLSDPYCQLLLAGEKEISYYWTDSDTGVKVKCRPDCRTDLTESSVVVDLKSCENANIDAFIRDIFKYGYDLQAAQYTTGVELYEQKKHKFVLIAVEKKPPYAVLILDFDEVFNGEEKAIMKGYDKYREFLGLVAECRMTGVWYDYRGSDDVPGSLNIPQWLKEERMINDGKNTLEEAD